MKYLISATLLTAISSAQAGPQLTGEQRLGERLFNDKNLSLNKNQSCASCHSLKPARAQSLPTKRVPGFVAPDNVRTGSAVSEGSIPGLFGSLNAPSVGYAAHSPEFHWDDEEGLYIGGQFWNGRAGNLAEQAKMPFLNPVEMAMPGAAAVIGRIKQDKTYQSQFMTVYGLDLKKLSNAQAPQAFEDVAQAIAAYE